MINRRLKEFRNSIDEQIENCDEVITVEVLRSKAMEHCQRR